MSKTISFKSFYSVFLIAVLCFSVCSSSLYGQSKRWVGTWGTAPYAAGTNTPPSPYLANNTLRQIVRVSIGGDSLRLKFSNATQTSAVTMNSVNIAVSPDGTKSAVNASTITQLKFNGSASVTMTAGGTATSDAVAFPLTPNMRLAITSYYGQCATNSTMTHHYGSRASSYILTGNQTANADFAGATTVDRWYTITGIDVWASKPTAAVAVLGNSITDGYGLTGGLHNRWTDIFSERVNANPATSRIGVLNLGIGGTNVTSSGLSRYQQDILGQAGLRYFIIFYGTNDIGGGVSATTIINSYKKMIADAHAQNIRVYGATITPFGGNAYFSAAHEAVRSEVNKWIRTPGHFDKCIDFDKALRNPSDTTKIQTAYNNDGLHPNVAGYRFLGESVPLNLFTASDTTFTQTVKTGIESYYFEAERFVTATAGTNFSIVSDVQASNGKYITAKAGVQAPLAATADSTGIISIPFTVTKDTTYNVYGRVNCPTANDDSYWVKMDDGAYANCNGLTTSSWAWLKIGSYPLTKGKHALTIGYREDGACLDKICVSTDDASPSGMGGADVGTNVKSLKSTTGYSLGQNFPNPFNDRTNISFEIPTASFVSLKVLNSLGAEIAELAGREFSFGKHTLEFNSNRLPTGIYIYAMKAGNCSLSREMILKRN